MLIAIQQRHGIVKRFVANVRVPRRHRDACVATSFLNDFHVGPGFNQAARKGMAQIVPAKLLYLGLRKDGCLIRRTAGIGGGLNVR